MKSIKGSILIIVVIAAITGGFLPGCCQPNRKDMLAAIEDGEATKVRQILECDGEFFVSQQEDLPLLHWATVSGYEEIARLLIAHGFDVNACVSLAGGVGDDATTPLWCAVGRGDTRMVKLLVDEGADVNDGMEEGRTPLDFAQSQAQAGYGPQYEEIAVFLLKHGARRSGPPNSHGR